MRPSYTKMYYSLMIFSSFLPLHIIEAQLRKLISRCELFWFILHYYDKWELICWFNLTKTTIIDGQCYQNAETVKRRVVEQKPFWSQDTRKKQRKEVIFLTVIGKGKRKEKLEKATLLAGGKTLVVIAWVEICVSRGIRDNGAPLRDKPNIMKRLSVWFQSWPLAVLILMDTTFDLSRWCRELIHSWGKSSGANWPTKLNAQDFLRFATT